MINDDDGDEDDDDYDDYDDDDDYAEDDVDDDDDDDYDDYDDDDDDDEDDDDDDDDDVENEHLKFCDVFKLPAKGTKFRSKLKQNPFPYISVLSNYQHKLFLNDFKFSIISKV